VIRSSGVGHLDLGGYAHLTMPAATRLRIEGRPHEESVYLQAGEVLSEVDGKHGSFSVRTDDGMVRVTGTRFLVAVRPTDKGEVMATRTTFVKVFAGAVIVSGAWGTQTVQAGSEMSMPPARTLADQPAPAATFVRGIIKTVDGKTLTVTDKSGEVKTVTLTDKTEIVKGRAAYGDPLKVGDSITARIVDGVAVRIEVHAEPAKTGDAK
jgi:hypothetical protein